MPPSIWWAHVSFQNCISNWKYTTQSQHYGSAALHHFSLLCISSYCSSGFSHNGFLSSAWSKPKAFAYVVPFPWNVLHLAILSLRPPVISSHKSQLPGFLVILCYYILSKDWILFLLNVQFLLEQVNACIDEGLPPLLNCELSKSKAVTLCIIMWPSAWHTCGMKSMFQNNYWMNVWV